MLLLTCRDFQVEFWIFSVRNCVKCVEIWIAVWLPCTVNVQLSDRSIRNVNIQANIPLRNCVKCDEIWSNDSFTWSALFHTVLCSYTWTMHVRLYKSGLQWHKMNRKCPEHPSSCFLTTDSGRTKVLTGCYFFACLVFSPHDMNVFVIDLTVDNVVNHMQGFASGILIILCWKLCEMWRNLDCRVSPVHGKRTTFW